MNGEVKMSVSSMTRKDGNKAVYVLFQDGKREAEFAVPGCRMVRNSGFSDEEVRSLRDFVDGEQDKIFAMAKEAGPIKAFLK